MSHKCLRTLNQYTKMSILGKLWSNSLKGNSYLKQMLHSQCQRVIVRLKIVGLVCILFHQANLEGLPGGGGEVLVPLFPSQIVLCSHVFPYLFRLTQLLTTCSHHQYRHQYLVVPAFPETGSCPLVP